MQNHLAHDKKAKENILKHVETYGCHLALLESDGYLPAFAYSIGLFENYQHPELIVFGMPTEVMGIILNYLRDEIKSGKSFVTGQTYEDVLEGYEVQFLEVNKDNYPEYFGYGAWYYNNSFDFPALQLVWPDKEAKWPWEEGFNEKWKFKQPLLDRNNDFKFHEEPRLGVYTTHHALDGKPVLYVYHNEDGNWQFHTEYDPKIEDSKIVCLKDLVAQDPTLNEVHYLNYGQAAYREKVGGKWTVEDKEEENTGADEKENKKGFWSSLKSKWFNR